MWIGAGEGVPETKSWGPVNREWGGGARTTSDLWPDLRQQQNNSHGSCDRTRSATTRSWHRHRWVGPALYAYKHPLFKTNKQFPNTQGVQNAHRCLTTDVYTCKAIFLLSISRESLVKCLEKAFDGVDVLITSGGVSMGEKVCCLSLFLLLTWMPELWQDLLKPVLEDNFNATIHFGRVLMKPGYVIS